MELKSSEEKSYLSDGQFKNFTSKSKNFQAADLHQQDLNHVRIPKPPKGDHKPVLRPFVQQTQAAGGAKPLDCTADWLRLDDEGMVVPHSILGSLEEFRRYLEAKGQTELLKRIPKPHSHPEGQPPEKHHTQAVEIGNVRNIQSNALQNWQTHMRQRRQQQDFLSVLLDRPVENLLMNQASRFTETPELREIPHQDISGLEVLGSCRPHTHGVVCRSPSVVQAEEGEEPKRTKENLDPLTQFDDVHSETLIGPALRFCGQLATFTGIHNNNQGATGVSATILFEALTGEVVSSHLELRNEGSTAIFYSWQQLPMQHTFPSLRTQKKATHFYFNSSSGVILPGDTRQVEAIFRSLEPGIKTEVWQLITHPLLLQGASMQVKLRGVALYQDKTADQRHFLEMKLEKIVVEKMCRSLVYKALQGVHSPERPRSPVELYVTEEQQFLSRNPKVQFHDESVEELKKLWQEVNPGHTWDLSVDTLRQVLMSLPESAQEKNLAQLNYLLVQLSESSVQKHKPWTGAALGQQLWRKTLDTMDDEARRLRKLLGLPDRDTWSEKMEEPFMPDADETSEESERAAAKERNGSRLSFKDDGKGKSKSAATRKQEGGRKKGKRRESVSPQPPKEEELTEEPEVVEIYTRLLHRKVYALIEDLVDSLCDLMEESQKKDDL